MITIILTFSFLVIASVTGIIFYGLVKNLKEFADALEQNPDFEGFQQRHQMWTEAMMDISLQSKEEYEKSYTNFVINNKAG